MAKPISPLPSPADATPSDPAAPGSAPGGRWPTVLVSGAGILMTLDVTIVNVALPDIADDLGARLGGLQWVVSAYTLAFAALLLAAGSVSDRIGRRRVFGAGVALFTLASAACAIAPNVGLLVTFRGVQGVGAAMVMATSLALLASAYAGAARQTAIGVYSGLSGAAAALGPLVGGALVDGLGWRWIFLINLPVGALVVLGARFRLPDDATASAGRGRIDLAGVLLAITGLFALNYAVLRAPEQGWTDTIVLGTLVGGAVLVIAFVVVEMLRPRMALLDLRLFRIPSFSGAILASLFARITSFGLLPFLILWLQGMLGNSPFQTGVKMLALTGPILLIAPLSGLVLRVLMPGQAIGLGFAVAGVGVLTMTRVDADSSWTVMLPGFVLLGISGGLSFPPLMGVAVGVVPAERAGMASGATNMFFPLGTSIGIAAGGALLTARVGDDLGGDVLARGGVPSEAVDQVRDGVVSGRFAPLAEHPAALADAREAFTSGLAQVCLLMSVLAFVAAVLCTWLIRDGDRHEAAEATTR
ncbi:MFS transporter [Embleya sp. NPDC005971]|uniref:MFS transporter n=1 Tax=Embleya sp. NPDC005971 TaxID=3156724 RepID=UPI0033C3A869